MGPKKSPKADLQRYRKLFFEVGLAVSLCCMISVFSCSTDENIVEEFDPGISFAEIDLVDITILKDEPADPVVRRVTVYSDVINVVETDRQINTDYTWDEFGEDISVEPIRRTEEIVKEPDFFVKVEKMPGFGSGDLMEFRNWVNGRIKYPSDAADNRIEGLVSVEFVVETDGSLSNIKVLQSPDKSLSDEVVRVVRQSPKWEPGRQNRHAVRVKLTLPIQFKLN